ncbi:MAG: class I SAM-dependent methyltransferase [Acidobacteriota bacterium]
MPIPLNDDERRLFFESNERPGPYLDLLGTAGFRIATSALRLGVFEALADGPSLGEPLAKRLDLDPLGTEILLEALEGYGYVERGDDGFGLTDMARTWQLPAKSGYDYTLVHKFWSLLLFQLWGDLEGTIRRGHPGIHLYSWLDERPEAQRTFQAMLGMLAELNGDEILTHLDLPDGPVRLLDVGAGHGRHALAFCRNHAEATATLVDLPSSLEVAQENAEAAGLADRVECLAVDFLREDMGSGFDVAFLFSIVHSFEPAENLALLRRVHRSLAPGGVLLLLEQLAGETRQQLPLLAEAFHRAFRLNLFHLLGGRTYTQGEVRGWLEETGFEITEEAVLESTGDQLLVARRV